jgi:hypothetical protein
MTVNILSIWLSFYLNRVTHEIHRERKNNPFVYNNNCFALSNDKGLDFKLDIWSLSLFFLYVCMILY